MTDQIIDQFINWLDTTNAWKLFFETLSKYNIRFKGYPAFEMSDYFKIIDRVEPNSHYVFLSVDTKSLSAKAIEDSVKNAEGVSYFTHAGIVFLNGDRNTSVMQVRDTGFVEQPLLDLLKSVDYFCVVKLPILEGKEDLIDSRIQDFRNRTSSIQYDWQMQLDNDPNLIYCSELVYDVFKDTVDNPNFKPRVMMGRDVFDPDILLGCGEIIYCNHPDLKNI